MFESTRLRYIPCTLDILRALNATPIQVERLGLSAAAGWPDFPEAFLYSEPLIAKTPALAEWWAYLFVLRDQNLIVGSGGYKGPPEDGMVEIGYEIAPGYRGQGLATEAAQALIDNAFAVPAVTMVDAHTLPEANPSTRVLEKVGMRFLGVVDDPDGPVWHWRVTRPAPTG